jgi:hypothetical protein
MRRTTLFSLVAALAVVLAAQLEAKAGHCGAATCPPPCPDTCCYPKIRYKTQYQTVVEERPRVVCKTVPRTVMQERRYTVCKPVYETKHVTVKQVVCKPVWEEKQVTVCVGEWKTEMVWCPGQVVTKKVTVECPDACNGCDDGCNGCGKGHFLHRLLGRGDKQTVCVQVQCPGKWVCKKVWVPRQEVRTVRVCRMVQEEVTKVVPVTTCRMVKEEVCKMVPVTVCEKVQVCEIQRVCKRVAVKVPVCEMECKREHFLHRLFRRDRDCCDAAPCAPASYPVHHGPAPHGPTGPGAEPIKVKPQEK